MGRRADTRPIERDDARSLLTGHMTRFDRIVIDIVGHFTGVQARSR